MSALAETKKNTQTHRVFSRSTIEDILKRLPSKSLMRFKCVSHSFDALIKNPKFGLKQLSHYKQTNSNSIKFLLKYSNVESHQTTMVQLSTGGGDRLSATQIDLPKKPCSSLYPHEFSLVGHCNGVLCLCCPPNCCLCGSVILYNPTIRESKVVPQPLSFITFEESLYSRRVKFGFGCSPKTNDLVVIMITTFLLYPTVKAHDFPGKFKSYTLFEEYSLRANSWREMKRYYKLFFIKRFWVSHKGIYYWTAEFLSRREVILRFDSLDERLGIVPMPDDVEFNSRTQTCLGMVQDSLLLVCSNNADSHFSIWMTNLSNIDNLMGSWIMIAYISESNIPRGLWPFLVSLKGYEILLGVINDRFLVYDVLSNKVKKLFPSSNITFERHELFDGLHAINYVQSIISVNRRNKLSW